MKYWKWFLVTLLSSVTFSAHAGQATDALNKCFEESTSGKDRKLMAQWIFVAMSTYPELNGLSNVSAEVHDNVDKQFAAAVNRLLTVDCAVQARAAYKAEGQASITNSFETLGRLAMREITVNPNVGNSLTSYAKYLDKQKLATLFGTNTGANAK